MRVPAAGIALPLVCGVAIGAYVGAPAVRPGAAWLWVACALALSAWVRRRGGLLLIACAAGCCAAGVVIGGRAAAEAVDPPLLTWWRTLPPDDRGQPLEIEGILRDDAAPTEYGASIAIAAARGSSRQAGADVEGGVRVSIGGTLARAGLRSWRKGRRVRVTATLHEPLDYRDPGVSSDRARLARQGVVLLGSVKSALLVKILARGTPLEEAASWVRAQVRAGTVDTVGRWSAQSAGVITAILIGDRTGLRPEDERRLQEAGTYHVIAISGGNIALVMGIVIATARRVRLRPRAAAGVTLAIVVFYGYLAGLAPSVQRATLAGAVYLAARLIDHRGSALNALAIAAVVSAVTAPLTILDGGFVLSFGATLGILLVADRLMPRGAPRRDLDRFGRTRSAVMRAAWALAAATLCAELALAPVSARLFGRISLAGFLLNFAAIPLMCIAQAAGALAVSTWPLSSGVAVLIGWVAHLAATGLVESARLVDVLPWLVLDVPPPGLIIMAMWYVGIALALAGRRRVLRRAGVTVSVVSAVAILLAPAATRADAVEPPPDGWLRIVFLDVGQGDATVVIPPRGRPLLVDAGGVAGSGFDLGRHVTVPALWALGADRLAVMALTHGDPDHIGGAPAVLRALAPREVWEGIPVPRHEPMRALRAEAIARGARWREVRVGDRGDLGTVGLRVLHPPEPDWERQKVRNDDSIVLELRYGDVAFVLPGDIGAEGEALVAPRLEPAPLTIVKAPHHGSATSSSPGFIAASHPSAVIFSAGRRNHFGHPVPAVMARYVAAGARVFRTDLDGAVFVDTDGRTIRAWTWTGRAETWTAGHSRQATEGRRQ